MPAVYGITGDPYLVFATNAFALLGLRALYFVVEGALGSLRHLGHGLAAILAFIGVKLVLHWAHGVWPSVPEVPTLASLGVIVGILALATTTSILANRRDERRDEARAQADGERDPLEQPAHGTTRRRARASGKPGPSLLGLAPRPGATGDEPPAPLGPRSPPRRFLSSGAAVVAARPCAAAPSSVARPGPGVWRVALGATTARPTTGCTADQPHPRVGRLDPSLCRSERERRS